MSQYLAATGRTLFFDMRFDELHRAQIDVETASLRSTAPDAAVSVSIRLAPHEVTVRNGLSGRPDVAIETGSENLIGLSSVPLRFGLPDLTKKEGRAVNRKLLSGELKVRGLFRHPRKLARLNKLLSVT